MAIDQTTTTTGTTETGDTLAGFLFAISAYGLWGLMPLYMKLVAHIPAVEVVAHRALWSVPVAGAVLLVLRRTADITAALRSPRTLLMAALTAGLISVNWGIYVWAIAVDRAVETALGYYINPLVTVVMGAVLLGEKLSRPQLAAVLLACVAVIILTVDAGGLPWVSLALAFSFAAYGFLRKTLPIGPSQGFFLEVMILSVPALGFAIWVAMSGQSHFTTDQPMDMLLLILCGPVTAIPLILFAFGAKLLRYSSIGIMQYVAPTMITFIAVFVFQEPFGPARVAAFALIWVALAIFTWSMLKQSRDASAAKAPAAH